MKRIGSTIAGAALLLAAGGSCATGKPNVVYILVDNWGWGDISVQGSTVPTPAIDALASQGLRLTNFNVQNQCTPTRSAIHTGRLPIRSGTQKVPAPGEPQGMAPWECTIAELLSDAGYATASPIVQHTFPKVYDIRMDPGETRELWSAEGYAHLWVMKPVMEILGDLARSMERYPNIAPGEDFTGYQ